MNYQEEFEKAIVYKELILPKLQALYNGGNAGWAHDAANHMLKITEAERYYLWKQQKGDVSDLYALAVTFYEYIRSAEIWMCKIAGVEYKWPKQKEELQ